MHTDHKPLVMICAKPLTKAPPRLQRLLIKIQGYKFEIEYKPGESMILSDTLSRLPNPTKRGDILLDPRVDGIDFQDVEDIHKVDLINFGSSKREALQVETSKDPVLRGLTQVINTGWPESIKELPQDLRPYWAYRDELGLTSGVVFKAGKGLAVVYRLKTTTSAAVARVTADIFGLLGPPAEIVSDNGPQFIGGPYQDMCSRWAIKHTTSSPRYPQSNGLAERMVRTVKALIKKCKQTGQDIGIAMLHLRATPTDPSMLAPAEVMFGRPIRTTLPSRHAASTLQQSTETYERLLQRQSVMKEHHDTRRAGPALPPLHVGQRVRVQDHQRHTWSPAEVTRKCSEPRSYEVTTRSGSAMRRNRSQIREMEEEPPANPRPVPTTKGPPANPRPAPTTKGPPANPRPVPATDTRPIRANIAVHQGMNTRRKSVRFAEDLPPSSSDESTPVTTRSGRAVRAPVRYSNI